MRNPMLELVLAACLSCGMLFAGGPNNYQGPNNGDWSSDANWSQGHVPRPDEDVGITGVTVNAPGTINVMSLHLIEATLCIGDKTSRPHVAPVINGDLELEGSKLYVYAGELTDYSVFETEANAMAAIRAAANTMTIGGDFSVGGTSIVYPESGKITGVPVIFKVGGDFTLAEGASFNVIQKGWGWSTGAWADRPSAFCKPRKTEGGIVETGWTFAIGSGLSYSTGGQYGSAATGSSWQGYTYAKSYGPTFAPLFSGAPGGYYQADVNLCRGPGSIVVLAAGDATINGTMNADAWAKGLSHDHSGSSGGGIWLAASSFTFGENALLTAEGGLTGNNIYAPGGGGRIALAEGCSAEDIASMFAGTLPEGLSEGQSIVGVTVSVQGGAKPNGSRGDSGSVSTVRPVGSQAVLTTASDVAGLVAEGITWGDVTYANGTYSFTAPEYAYLASDSGVRYACAGYAVTDKNGTVTNGAGRTAEFTVSGPNGPYTLTWLWDTREALLDIQINGTGKMTWNNVDYTTNFTVYVPSGVSQTFVAEGLDGWSFNSWSGTAVPGGSLSETTLTIAPAASGTIEINFAQGRTTRVWTGAAGDGKWKSGANWSPAGVPLGDDDAYLTNVTITVDHPVSVGSLTISGASKITFQAVGFDGASTTANLYGNATVVKTARELVIDGTSVVTTANDPVTGAAVKLDCASFYLGSSAKVTASEKGWFWYDGTDDEFKTFTQSGKYQTRALGPGNSFTQGGGHGAIGGNPLGSYCQAYGYKYAPFLPGSPNGVHNGSIGNAGYPGGTVWIVCDGLCELYGTVTSDGQRKYYGSPSGGGVWICAKGVKATGTTLVTVIGGYMEGNYSSMGAGGRVSLALGLTDAQLDALAAGEEPEGLTYTDAIDLFAVSVRGGERAGQTPTYGNSGTATTVTGPLAYVNVTIGGSPVNALGVEPANGVEAYEGGTTQTFTAPEYGIDPADPSVRYACTGHVVSNALGEVSSGAGLSVDVAIANGPLSVTWFWGAAQKRVLVRKPANGSLTVNDVTVNGDAVTWTTGQMASIGAVPSEGYEFVCWEGNVPFGFATSNPLAAEIDEPLDITPVFRPVAEPTTRTWKANAKGDWKAESNWEPAGIPGAGDTLVVSSGTLTFSNALVAAGLQVSGGTVKVAAAGNVNGEVKITGDAALTGGTVELGYGSTWWEQNGFKTTPNMTGRVRLAVGGDLAISGAAQLAVHAGPITEDYTFATGCSFIEVSGALTMAGTSQLLLYSDFMTGGSVKITARTVSVGATAKIDAYAKGFSWLDDATPPNAPGLGYSYNIGASHGGVGGDNSADSVYGFELSPVMPGSPNGVYNSGERPGGGLIRIHAKSISVDGTLDAGGYENTTYGGASGGGIWLTADEFTFGANAVLTAVGGASNYSSKGGGGRIAISRALSAARLAQLAETGVYSGPSKRVKSEAEFRALYGNETMTIGLGTTGSTDPARLGTFTYLDDLNYATLFFVK